MNYLQYILILLICFSATLIGGIVAYFTEEELAPGEKYFKVLRAFLFLAILFYFVKSLSLSIIINLFFCLIFLICLIRLRKYQNFHTVLYWLQGIVLGISYSNSYFIVLSPLIFLLGLTNGTLFSTKYVLNKEPVIVMLKDELKNNFLFLAVGLVLILNK